MTLQAQLGTVKDVEAGHGIFHGRTYLTPSDTSTAIVPVGYADGIHRSASGFDMEGAKHVVQARRPGACDDHGGSAPLPCVRSRVHGSVYA